MHQSHETYLDFTLDKKSLGVNIGLNLLGSKASFTTSRSCVQGQNQHSPMKRHIASNVNYTNCLRLELKLRYSISSQLKRSA